MGSFGKTVNNSLYSSVTIGWRNAGYKVKQYATKGVKEGRGLRKPEGGELEILFWAQTLRAATFSCAPLIRVGHQKSLCRKEVVRRIPA